MNNQEKFLFKEKTKHGTLMTPFAKYHTDLSSLLPFYPIHWHEEVEIIRVCSGEGNLCIGGNWYHATSGQIFIISPFVLHSINKQDDCDMSTDTVVFNLRLLETASADAATLKYFAPMLTSQNSAPCIINSDDTAFDAVSVCIDTIVASSDKDEGYELSIKANLFWIFYHVFANKMSSTKSIKLDDKRLYTIKLALQHIRSNYMKSITVEDIADKCGYSPFYMMKLFKQYTGLTCIEYINNYRLNVAGELLLSVEDDISDIAYQVGYNNVSYFNRIFLTQYGMTPKQFRNQYRLL